MVTLWRIENKEEAMWTRSPFASFFTLQLVIYVSMAYVYVIYDLLHY